MTWSLASRRFSTSCIIAETPTVILGAEAIREVQQRQTRQALIFHT